MKKIQFSPPDISDEEINEVVKTMKSGWITTGNKVKEFENQISSFCNTKKSICMGSATSCMELALHILGVGPGDEVIVTPYTYTASCSVICHVGATPIMIDLAPDSFEMDYDKVYSCINEKTKVIIPVDLGGILCNYDKIFDVVNSKKHLFKGNSEIQNKIGRICVLSDSAHSFGASYKGRVSGSIADFTAFSFHAIKNLTTAEGGALSWIINDNNIYNNLSYFSLHGQNKDALTKLKSSDWEYDILFPGYKCNMTDILASIGVIQLKRFNFLISKRRKLCAIYNNLLQNENIEIYQKDSIINESTIHLYIIRLNGKDEKGRNELIERLSKRGICTNVHYKPLPMMTAYKNLGFNINNFPNAFRMYENEMTLPLHTLMSEDDVEYVCNCFKNELQKI